MMQNQQITNSANMQFFEYNNDIIKQQLIKNKVFRIWNQKYLCVKYSQNIKIEFKRNPPIKNLSPHPRHPNNTTNNDKNNNRNQNFNMYNSRGFKHQKFNRQKKKNEPKSKTELTEENTFQQNRNYFKGMTLEQYLRGQSRAENQNQSNQRKKEVIQADDQKLEYQRNFKIDQTDEQNYKQSQRESKKYDSHRIILPIVINPNLKSRRNILQLPLKTQANEVSKQTKKIRHARFPTMLQQQHDFLNKNNSTGRPERIFYRKQQKSMKNEKSKSKISQIFTVRNNFYERSVKKMLTASDFYKKNLFNNTQTQFKSEIGKLSGYVTKYNSKFRHFSKQK